MGKRILVADDSRTIQQAFAMVMDGAGYTLSFAKSVDEAVAVAKRDGRPDLVLSDAVLGNGSGYDLCAQFKAEAGLRDVPVYILASAQNPYDDARGRKVGADGHLLKPFESQALLDAVASALATPARRSSAAMPAENLDASSTSRYSEDEVVGEDDDDSYGEITIERGAPAPAPAPAASAWTARPPTRPSSARPLPTAPAPVVSPQPAPPRAPMIPAPRPSIAMPSVPSGPIPSGLGGMPPLPQPPQPRQPARTMMGFPSPKTGAATRPAGFPIPGAPPVMAPAAPMPSRPATMPPTTAPVRGPSFPTPAVSAAPLVAKPSPSSSSMPMVAPARPVPSRLMPTPASPTAAIPAAAIAPQPSARRPVTPEPVVPSHAPPATLASAVAAAASDRIEQTMASIAARGPEYEAIAKLSREIIEQVVWEVVPELAETIIRQEIDRLATAKK